MPPSPGAFVWYELMTPDLPAAEAFYAAVTGWGMADAGMPGQRYTLAGIGGRPVAGLMAPPPEMPGLPTGWTGYILVADVDEAAAAVAAAGGTIHRPPADIPGVGRFAAVADPQGAAVMLFRGTGAPPPDLPPGTPGSIGWHELRTSDWPAAFAFYHGQFGWTEAYAHDMGPMGVYQTFTIAGAWTGGMMTAPGAPPHWSYYIAVDDIDAAAQRVATAGGTVLNGPHPVPGDTWVLAARDPLGTAFALTGPRLAA